MPIISWNFIYLFHLFTLKLSIKICFRFIIIKVSLFDKWSKPYSIELNMSQINNVDSGI